MWRWNVDLFTNIPIKHFVRGMFVKPYLATADTLYDRARSWPLVWHSDGQQITIETLF